MSTDIEKKFQEIIDDLIRLNRKLLKLCKNKQDAIFDQNQDRLQELTEDQEVISDQIDEVNQKRREFSKKLLPEESEPISLKKVTETISAEEEISFEDRRVQLKQILRDVQRFSRENRQLLENRISMFDHIFEELEQQQKSQETYDKESEKQEKTKSDGMFIDEAI